MSNTVRQKLTISESGSSAANLGKWQIGFYEHGDITIVGVFDHAMGPSDTIASLGENDSKCFDDGQEWAFKTINALLPAAPHYFYISLIPALDWFDMRKRPSDFSSVQWLFLRRHRKIQSIMERELAKDLCSIVMPIETTTDRISIYIGSNSSLLQKYFNRLGVNPDMEPDILYVSKGKISSEQFMQKARVPFMKRISLNFFNAMTQDDFLELRDLLTDFNAIFWAIDGHLFYATRTLKKAVMLERLKYVAEDCKLKIAHGLILN